MEIKINAKNGTYEYTRFNRDGTTRRVVAVIRSRSEKKER